MSHLALLVDPSEGFGGGKEEIEAFRNGREQVIRNKC